MKNGFGVQSIASRSAMLQNIGPAFNFVISQRTFLHFFFVSWMLGWPGKFLKRQQPFIWAMGSLSRPSDNGFKGNWYNSRIYSKHKWFNIFSWYFVSWKFRLTRVLFTGILSMNERVAPWRLNLERRSALIRQRYTKVDQRKYKVSIGQVLVNKLKGKRKERLLQGV